VDPHSTSQLSFEEQQMERLCDEERYKSLENGNGSDDEYEGMFVPLSPAHTSNFWCDFLLLIDVNK
jgi:hypothetical protein